MATATPTAANLDAKAASSSAPSGRWLHGPILDIAIGCGGLYAWIALLYVIDAPALHAWQPGFLIAFMLLAVSMPHYGGTLVRVYDQRGERKKYFLFTVVATIAVFAVFVVGLHNAWIGSIFFTVYMTWSPWHYTGQNYGLSVMFLRRRGIALDDLTKRVLYTSFVLSFLLTFLLWHTAARESGPRGESGGTISFVPIGIPEAIDGVAVPGVALLYAGTLAFAFARLLRNAKAMDLLPVACLVATQALWFSIPFAVSLLGAHTGLVPIDQYFDLRIFTIWTVMAHAAQYLWVTSYYAKSSPEWRGPVHYYGKAAASGVAIWTLPAILFSADAFGTYSYNGGLALMIAAAVNIHHFILDGAIWKLRNTKIASVLIRSDTSAAAGTEDAAQRDNPTRRTLIWAIAIAVMLSAYYVFWQKNFVLNEYLREDNLQAYEAGLDRMELFGRDSEGSRIRLGEAYANDGNFDASLAQFERAAELSSSMQAFNGLMVVYWGTGNYQAVVDVTERALEHYPNEAGFLTTQSEAWRALGDDEAAAKATERAQAISQRPAAEDEATDKLRLY